ncbi:acyl carrier protein [Pseudomonas sp. CC6-YY-74]|uniref:acyl carrier protein n=1 Tax=Pseudomonas sp. CC6-YY-74 TaxID=1930532 RepID=UPI0009A17072|nr:acyl carrier protein [Pseudomonas sp. CC6-YY-74]
MNNPVELDVVIASAREILAQLLVIDTADIAPDSSLIEDLSADSLDIVDLSFQLGRMYGCTLPKTTVLDHAVTVCGDLDAFVFEGGLTETGKALLENSLSAYTPNQLRVGMKPVDVFAVTTVRNWAEQCRGVFNYLPAVCPECAGEHAKLNERQQVVCSSCSARVTPLDGDEISQVLVGKFVATHLSTVA